MYQQREWNRAKDLESFNARISGYSGRHGGSATFSIPAIQPLIGPYVEYEFTDHNGDVWEKLGGSEEKLREFVSEHPEQTFLDGEGNLLGANPMQWNVSIQNNFDNSRQIFETNYNDSITNNYFNPAGALSVNVGGSPVNVVVNATPGNSFPTFFAEEKKENNLKEASESNSSGKNVAATSAIPKVTINNSIAIETQTESAGPDSAPNSASASAVAWVLKKLGLRAAPPAAQPAPSADLKSASARKPPANVRMLASVSEFPVEVPSHFNWYALAFVVTALTLATRELQRIRLRRFIPVPVKRRKEKRSRRQKPSEGTRATSATRMNFRK